jgi:hypothetical protein
MGVISNGLLIEIDMTVPALDVFSRIGLEGGYVVNVRSRLRALPGKTEDIVKLPKP